MISVSKIWQKTLEFAELVKFVERQHGVFQQWYWTLVEKKRSKWPEIFWQESLNHIWPSSFMEKKVLKILCRTSYMFKTGQKSYFIDIKTSFKDFECVCQFAVPNSFLPGHHPPTTSFKSCVSMELKNSTISKSHPIQVILSPGMKKPGTYIIEN